jgi:hypothetical protein
LFNNNQFGPFCVWYRSRAFSFRRACLVVCLFSASPILLPRSVSGFVTGVVAVKFWSAGFVPPCRGFSSQGLFLFAGFLSVLCRSFLKLIGSFLLFRLRVFVPVLGCSEYRASFASVQLSSSCCPMCHACLVRSSRGLFNEYQGIVGSVLVSCLPVNFGFYSMLCVSVS